MLGNIIARSSADPQRKQSLKKLKGTVVIQAGAMAVTLLFDQGHFLLRRGAAAKPQARVVGSLDTLLRLSLGGGMILPVLSGRLKARGNLFLLLKIRRLLRV